MTIAPRLHIPLIAALLIAAGTAAAQTPPAGITADELLEHVRTLASDEFEGRGAGTEGNEKAAAYIVKQFRAAGLKPAGDAGEYTQSFEFVKSLELGPGNTFALSVPTTGGSTRDLTLAPDVDFRPLGFSSSASVQGEVVDRFLLEAECKHYRGIYYGHDRLTFGCAAQKLFEDAREHLSLSRSQVLGALEHSRPLRRVRVARRLKGLCKNSDQSSGVIPTFWIDHLLIQPSGGVHEFSCGPWPVILIVIVIVILLVIVILIQMRTAILNTARKDRRDGDYD